MCSRVPHPATALVYEVGVDELLLSGAVVIKLPRPPQQVEPAVAMATLERLLRLPLPLLHLATHSICA
jgi:hypothetical protein